MRLATIFLAMNVVVGCGDDQSSSDAADTDTDTDADSDTDTDIDTDTGTGAGTGLPEIASYAAVCTNDTTYEGTLDTTHDTYGAAFVNMWETNASNGWSEEHFAVADGPLDHLTLTLAFTQDTGEVTSDESDGNGKTLFSCAADGQFLAPNDMTYAIRIYDGEGNLAQCCAFGFTPEIVASGDYITNGGSPSNADELDDCSTTCSGL